MEIQDDVKADILRSLVEFMVENKKPSQLVESKFFARFCMKINASFSLTNRRTCVRALHDEYSDAFQIFLAQIEHIPRHVALT